jgi:hypothetical protein
LWGCRRWFGYVKRRHWSLEVEEESMDARRGREGEEGAMFVVCCSLWSVGWQGEESKRRWTERDGRIENVKLLLKKQLAVFFGLPDPSFSLFLHSLRPLLFLGWDPLCQNYFSWKL